MSGADALTARLFVIGASGFVGSRLCQAAERTFDVVRGARRVRAEPGWVAIDIADPASVEAAFERARPRFVTLLAALSNIDRCEQERLEAESINAGGAMHVAQACARCGAGLLFTSSDAVFDGERGFYREDDVPRPLNWYGETKARAERAVAEMLPAATIVRLSLVLGTSAAAGGNSYLEKVVGNLTSGNAIVSPTYEYRNPIDVETLCALLVELTLSTSASGVFHIGASDKISRFELARTIAARLGHDAGLVVPQTEPVVGRAPRGRDTFLGTARVRTVCRTPIPTCQQVIERALGPLS
jgi:dTDP-4-dehydrorhamnose reductase